MTRPKANPRCRNGATSPPMPERFWSKADRSGGPDACWPWVGYINEDGYGQFNRTHTKPQRAHRVAYELTVGPIPAGFQLDHLCRNRSCVNPAHLEVVTNRTNILRGESPIARTIRDGYCKNGHARTPENLYVYPNGLTRCRVCNREDAKRRYHAASIAAAYREDAG